MPLRCTWCPSGTTSGDRVVLTDAERAAGLAALTGGSVGLIVAGTWLDASRSYGGILALFAIGPTLVALFVVRTFPETAHKELEEISDQTGR